MNLGTDLSWNYGGKLDSGGALSEILAQKSWRPGLLVSTVPYLRQEGDEIAGEGSLDWRTYGGCFSSSSTESLHTPAKEVPSIVSRMVSRIVTLSVVEDTVEGLAPEMRHLRRRSQVAIYFIGWGSCGNESILNNNYNLRVWYSHLSIIREAALQGLPMKHTFALARSSNQHLLS